MLCILLSGMSRCFFFFAYPNAVTFLGQQLMQCRCNRSLCVMFIKWIKNRTRKRTVSSLTSQNLTRKREGLGTSISTPAFVTLPKSITDQSDDSTGNCVHSELRSCSHVNSDINTSNTYMYVWTRIDKPYSVTSLGVNNAHTQIYGLSCNKCCIPYVPLVQLQVYQCPQTFLFVYIWGSGSWD